MGTKIVLHFLLFVLVTLGSFIPCLFKMADYNKKLEEPLSRGWGLPYSEVGTQACPLRRGAQRHTEAAEGWCPTDDWRGLGRPALSVLRFWHVMKILLFEFSPGLGLQNSVNCMSLGKTCRSWLKKPTLIPFLHEGGGGYSILFLELSQALFLISEPPPKSWG